MKFFAGTRILTPLLDGVSLVFLASDALSHEIRQHDEATADSGVYRFHTVTTQVRAWWRIQMRTQVLSLADKTEYCVV